MTMTPPAEQPEVMSFHSNQQFVSNLLHVIPLSKRQLKKEQGTKMANMKASVAKQMLRMEKQKLRDDAAAAAAAAIAAAGAVDAAKRAAAVAGGDA